MGINNSDYQKMTDEEIIKLIKNNDENALNYLLKQYEPIIASTASKYFIAGAENEDLIQEGNIGFFNAVRDFDETKDAHFKTFAILCVDRQIINAVKHATRKKNTLLNSSLSLEAEYQNDEGVTKLLDLVNDASIEDPSDTVEKREYLTIIMNKLDTVLSDFEKKVLELYIAGESYDVIAQKLQTSSKSIDNAVQRIRKKISRIVDKF